MVHLRVMFLGVDVLINIRVSSITLVAMGSSSTAMLSSLEWLCQVPIHPRSPASVSNS